MSVSLSCAAHTQNQNREHKLEEMSGLLNASFRPSNCYYATNTHSAKSLSPLLIGLLSTPTPILDKPWGTREET